MIAFLLTLYLVSAPDAPWTSGRAAAATAEAEAALAWWSLRTGGAAPTLSAPVFVETPTPYDRTTYMRTDAPGLYIVARVAGGPTLPNGRSGWARPGGFRLVVLETPTRPDAPLAALVAHEWGHAAYGLPDTEARGDIMGPDYPQAYAQGRVGCGSLRALGGGCVWLPVAQSEAPRFGGGQWAAQVGRLARYSTVTLAHWRRTPLSPFRCSNQSIPRSTSAT